MRGISSRLADLLILRIPRWRLPSALPTASLVGAALLGHLLREIRQLIKLPSGDTFVKRDKDTAAA